MSATSRPSSRLLNPLLVLAALAAGPLPTEAQVAAESPVGQAKGLIENIRQDIEAARQAGEDLAAEDSPARARVLTLWELGRANPAGEAGQLATEEAIHQLVHLGRYPEAFQMTGLLAPDEPAWPRVLDVLLEAGSLSGDYSEPTARLEERLERAPSAEDRAHALFALGVAYKHEERKEEAIAAFEEVIAATPDERRLQEAKAYLHELLNLNPGQQAPLFEAPTLTGGSIALDQYRGKIVVMSVWASW